MALQIKPGVVHEYNADGSYHYTEHVDAQLRCLEQLAPTKAAPIRARLQALLGRQFVGQDHINLVAKDISEALDKLAPAGFYFGIPRCNSNIAGFWPEDWLRPNVGGPIDAVVRAFGPFEVVRA